MRTSFAALAITLLASMMQVGCVLPAKPSTLVDGKVLVGCWQSSNANTGLFRLDLRIESDKSFRALVWSHDGSREWASGIWHVKESSLVLEPTVANLHADFKEAHLASAHLILHDPSQSKQFKFTLDGFSYFGPLAKSACSDFDLDATH